MAASARSSSKATPLLAALLVACCCCAAASSSPSPAHEHLARQHLLHAGRISPATDPATADAHVRAYVELLRAYATNSSAELSARVGVHPAELSGRHAQRLADALDEAWCERTGACGDGSSARRLRGVRDIADSLKGSPPKEYTAVLAWAAAASVIGNDEGSSQVTKYSEVDAQWARCITDWLARDGVASRPAPNVNKSYVYPLRGAPGNSGAIRIAILGDWGTGQPQELDMLDKIVNKFTPDIVLHLGDVYYSGTGEEQQEHVYQPVRKYLKKGMQFYAVQGNHDLYASGQAFFDVIDQLRRDNVTRQEGSFFALENTHWVIMGLDTARTDNNPKDVGTAMPYLLPNQLQWALDKLKKAKAANKRTILASHHQLFTAASTVGEFNGTNPAVNVRLYGQVAPYIRRVAAWFWGHEHSIQAFAPYAGLQRGRLLGNSGVPVLGSSNPYEPNGDLVVPKGEKGLPKQLPGSPTSKEASFGYYLQHSFAILTLTGRVARVDYYEVDWDCFLRKPCEWGDPKLMWTEKF